MKFFEIREHQLNLFIFQVQKKLSKSKLAFSKIVRQSSTLQAHQSKHFIEVLGTALYLKLAASSLKFSPNFLFSASIFSRDSGSRLYRPFGS